MNKFTEFKEACLHTLHCMESSALTLYWANMALLNGITHLVDAGLCLVNQMLRAKAKSPVVGLEFLLGILCGKVDRYERCADYQRLKTYLQAVADTNDTFPGGLAGSYVKVEGVGSNADYAQIEHYLQKYCGINHNSWYTVYKAWSECANKVIDFTGFMDMPESMLDARHLFRSMGVAYQDEWFHAPGGAWNAGHRFLVCIIEQPGPDKTFPSSVGTVWAHITQHLLVNALIGDVHLHSDNTVEMGKNLFALVASMTIPQQACPTGALVSEMFQFRNEEVVEDLVEIRCPREYFLRNRKCINAWRKGRMTELACAMGPHPIEDVLHIHAWLHTHIEHCGRPPTDFYVMPTRKMRSPELVPGRNYPVQRNFVVDGSEVEEKGVLCVCVNGCAFALLQFTTSSRTAFPIQHWQVELDHLNISVAPLVFRKHAVIALNSNGDLGIIQEIEDRLDESEYELLDNWQGSFESVIRKSCEKNYLDLEGNYSILLEDGTTERMCWTDVHNLLLPLGVHMLVEKTKIPPRYESRIPDDGLPYLLGWLRYPDECDADYDRNDLVFVAFRCIERNSTRRSEMEASEACMQASLA